MLICPIDLVFKINKKLICQITYVWKFLKLRISVYLIPHDIWLSCASNICSCCSAACQIIISTSLHSILIVYFLFSLHIYSLLCEWRKWWYFSAGSSDWRQLTFDIHNWLYCSLTLGCFFCGSVTGSYMTFFGVL